MEEQKPMSQIGTGEGEAPLALRTPGSPAPSFEARTFSSDLSSIRNAGGGEPVPYTPPPAGGPPARPRQNDSVGLAAGGVSPSVVPAAPPKPPVASPPGPSPFASGSIKPPFTPPSLPGALVPPSKGGGGKKMFVAILAFLIVIALGAIGYFFVYPLFFAEEEAETVTTPPPVLPETAGMPEATSTEPEIPEPETPAADPFQGIVGLSSHVSLFRTAPDATTEVILTAPTLAALTSALPSGSVATALMSEVVLTMPSGSVFPFSKLAPLIAPTFFTSERLASFDDDATYFTYAAGNGTWLGMIVSLKAGAPIGPVQDSMSALQSDPDLSNFFLENTGEKGVWADGNIHGKPASQVSFEAHGATFSYAWLERNLLISTNLTAAGEAATRLGF